MGVGAGKVGTSPGAGPVPSSLQRGCGRVCRGAHPACTPPSLSLVPKGS